jgi:hypothetical protein
VVVSALQLRGVVVDAVALASLELEASSCVVVSALQLRGVVAFLRVMVSSFPVMVLSVLPLMAAGGNQKPLPIYVQGDEDPAVACHAPVVA